MDDSPTNDHASASCGQRARSFDLYCEITRQITAMLERGVVPWRSPILGQSKAGYPRNLENRKEYRGVNVFLLAFIAYAKGYESAYWLTFNQAKAKGGMVKKGEKSAMVVFWKKYEVQDKRTGEKKEVPTMRFYRVFNLSQIAGIAAPDAVPYTPTDFQPIIAAEGLVMGYQGRPAIHYEGQRAFYSPVADTVTIPEPKRFRGTERYYATLFHELAHSTGHSSRLDRKLDTDLQPFGSPDYGKEELVAEMGAAFLCGHAGIAPIVVEDSASYISGWLGKLKQDKRLIIQAAAAGQRAADWIRGQRHQTDVNGPTSGESDAALTGPSDASFAPA